MKCVCVFVLGVVVGAAAAWFCPYRGELPCCFKPDAKCCPVKVCPTGPDKVCPTPKAE